MSEVRVAPRGLPPMREWQRTAFSRWEENHRRGVVVAATGTGKTRVALEAIDQLRGEGIRVVVVVPTVALQEQWNDQLRYQMRISPAKLGLLGGRTPRFDLNNSVVLCVMDSARKRLPSIVKHWRTNGDEVALVADECHRLTSDDAVALLSADYVAGLGLSATPPLEERSVARHLVPVFDRVVFELPLKEALDEKLLAPLHVLNVLFSLAPAELQEYRRNARQAEDLMTTLLLNRSEKRGGERLTFRDLEALAGNDERARSALNALRKNRKLVSNSRGRRAELSSLINQGILGGRRALVFNETIDQAEWTFRLVADAGFDVVMDHSRLSGTQRSQALKAFASGSTPVLVAVRALDEGIDVPEADLALIVSGTTSPRQRVQRIGRVVRPHGGVSAVVSLLASGTDEEFLVAGSDPSLVGKHRVRTVEGSPGLMDLDWILKSP